jgi:hypothetical protein
VGRVALLARWPFWSAPLLDPQVARELRLVASYLLDEALGILAPDERLDGIVERMIRARGGVADRVDEHIVRI